MHCLPAQLTSLDFVNSNIDPAALKELTLQTRLGDAWKSLDPEAEVAVLPSIQDAINHVRRKGEVQVLVTGSIHLVGGVISTLEDGNVDV